MIGVLLAITLTFATYSSEALGPLVQVRHS